MSITVYPTLSEILRSLLVSLDIKNYSINGVVFAKEIDNLVAKNIYDPREFVELFEGSFGAILKELLGENKGQIFVDYTRHFFMDYIQIASYCSVEGLTRQIIMPILIKGIGRKHILNLLFNMSKIIKGPNEQELRVTQVSFVPTVLRWFKGHDEVAWNNFYQELDESSKDRIQAWQSEGELPTVQQLKLLKHKDYIYEYELFVWLLVARATDYYMRSYNLTAQNKEDLMLELPKDIFLYTKKNISYLKRNTQKFPLDLLEECFDKLDPKIDKTEINKEDIRDNLEYLKYFFIQEDIVNWSYIFDFYLARWHVYNGDLEEALLFYKQSFKAGLFCSGKKLEDLIYEALIIAVTVEKGDIIFIKELKWAAILFKYDIPSVFDSKSSNKKEDNIQDWEIEMWQQSFETVFPKEGWFKDSKLKNDWDIAQSKAVGFLKPDYKNPNKKVYRAQNTRMGDGALISFGFIKRREPQLVYFMIFNKYDIVEKLIGSGASINVKSEVGDTPILIALRALNKTHTSLDTYRMGTSISGDERFFQLVSRYKHEPEIMNQETQKSRHLPIIAAVETGRLDIVKKVIQLGANVNIKGTLDDVTPLYRCIQIMGELAQKQHVFNIAKSSFKTQKMSIFAAMRRTEGGTLGHRISDYGSRTSFVNEELISQLMEVELDEYKAFSYTELFEIAKLLIDKGANVDEPHTIQDLSNFTPLMFTVENDLADLFFYMLMKNGDPKLQCRYMENGMTKLADCWDVAEWWGSEKTLLILNSYS